MRFHPSEDQLAIQASLRGTLARALPRDRLLGHLDTDAGLDRPLWDALMALGLGGLTVPERHGGSGLGVFEAALAMEVLGEAAAIGPFLPHLLTGLAIAWGGDEATMARFLRDIARGATVCTAAFGGGWMPESWTITIEGDAITGEVAHVEAGTDADLILVGVAGGEMVLVQADETVRATQRASSDGTRRLSGLEFRGAKVLARFALAVTDRVIDAGLTLLAADALGGAETCLALSVRYAKEREQFGQPIGSFQAIKHQLAQMALEVEPSRALVWYAAYAQDSGQADARRAAALAKAHVADRFVSVTRAAVQAHGGIGYTWDYGLHVWFRRALFDRAFLGSPALHRARAADLAGW